MNLHFDASSALRYGPKRKMIAGLFRFARFPVRSGLVIGLVATASAQPSPPASESPGASAESRASVSNTNLSALNQGKQALRNLEADLKRPFQLFDSFAPAGRVATPIRRTPPPVLTSPSVKALSDKQNDWPFMTPEDYAPTLTAEEMLKVPDGNAEALGKSRLTPLERYRERQGNSRPALTNLMRGDAWFTRRISPSDSILPDTVNSATPGSSRLEQTFRRLSDGYYGQSFLRESSTPAGLSSIWGNRPAPTENLVGRSPAQQKRIDDFIQLLEGGPDAGPSVPTATRSRSQTTSPSAAGSLDRMFGSGGASEPFPPGGASLQPAGPPQLSGPPVLPSLMPPPAPPSTSATRTPPPQFAIPKRAF